MPSLHHDAMDSSNAGNAHHSIHGCCDGLTYGILLQTPVPHQILLESRYLPNVWEKQMVLRSFFNKFGRVSGVVFLDWVQNSAQRFVISFEDAKPAQDLIGSAVKILSSTVFVKEVTQETINYRGGAAYLYLISILIWPHFDTYPYISIQNILMSTQNILIIKIYL